jgi:bis(5'-nucleosyl)-tetraphosphatase (symmetrical)
MHYLVGDLQGCDDAFERLLAEIGFSPSRDGLTLLGDLVNRGPGSLTVLRRVKAMGGAAQAVLGNHDLHLLAVANGIRTARRGDTIDAVLEADDARALLAWLRERPLALRAHGWLCVHAGVSPLWDEARTLTLAEEVSAALRSPGHAEFLRVMYGDEPRRWSDDLRGADRLRHLINVFTRMRFVSDDGTLELATKEGAQAAPAGYVPWFEIESRRTADVPVAFGYWSTLGLVDRDKLLALDTGCVWGGCLSAARVDGGKREIVQVKCVQAQEPQPGA